jgi:hypothetical protein
MALFPPWPSNISLCLPSIEMDTDKSEQAEAKWDTCNGSKLYDVATPHISKRLAYYLYSDAFLWKDCFFQLQYDRNNYDVLHLTLASWHVGRLKEPHWNCCQPLHTVSISYWIYLETLHSDPTTLYTTAVCHQGVTGSRVIRGKSELESLHCLHNIILNKKIS